MKIKSPIWEVGYELEYFLIKNHLLLNAKEEMVDWLGFSIDQNHNNQGKLVLGDGFTLRTDGTAMEIQYFQSHQYGQIKAPWEKLNKVNMPHQRYLKAYVKEGEKSNVYNGPKWKFDRPGKTYSSGKLLVNAYTGETKTQDKKEEANDVSLRTAGLHLHFSICSRAMEGRSHGTETVRVKEMNKELFNSSKSRHHCNELVKLADSCYKYVFVDSHTWSLSDSSKKRTELYQILGDYRVKHDTESGNPTLEYRQLDGEMMSESKLKEFLSLFQHMSATYIASLS